MTGDVMDTWVYAQSTVIGERADVETCLRRDLTQLLRRAVERMRGDDPAQPVGRVEAAADGSFLLRLPPASSHWASRSRSG